MSPSWKNRSSTENWNFSLFFSQFSIPSWSKKGHKPSRKSFSSSYGSSQLGLGSSLHITYKIPKCSRTCACSNNATDSKWPRVSFYFCMESYQCMVLFTSSFSRFWFIKTCLWKTLRRCHLLSCRCLGTNEAEKTSEKILCTFWAFMIINVHLYESESLPLLISTGFLKYPLELEKKFQLELKKNR